MTTVEKVVLVLLIVASIALGKVAGAAITSSGSGSGTAATGSLQNVTIDAMAQDPSESLLPGTTADATFAIDNPNASALTLISVVQNGSISVNGGSGCTLANSGVTFSDQTGLSISIPPDVTDYNVDLLSAMSMSASSNNGCQNATFTVPITITAHE